MRIRRDVEDRKGIIGGSSLAGALGLSTFSTPYEVYQTWLTGKQKEVSEELKQRFYMGHILEDFCAEHFKAWYPDENVKIVRRSNGAFANDEHPWLICHPDRIVALKDGRKVPLEIKTSSAYGKKKWGESGTDEIPYDYLLQCYDYFFCGVPNDLDEVWVLLFCDCKYSLYKVKKNPELEEHILSMIVETVEEHWMKGEAPELNTLGDIEEFAEFHEGDIVTEDEGIEALKTSYNAYSDQIAELEGQKEAIKEKIISKLSEAGGDTFLSQGGTRLFSYKLRQTSRLDGKRLRLEEPEVYNKYLKTSESRYFVCGK